MSDIKDESQLREIARQLSCPSGDHGLITAQNMASHNSNMISETILALDLRQKDRVLEIGPGGGAHVPVVISQSPEILYYGVDISELMISESIKRNTELVSSGQATFSISNGDSLSFVNEFFDKVFTVNTLYFWQNPVDYAQEVKRILKSGGKFCIAFASRHFMEKLPFTKYVFRLYSLDDAKKIFADAGFDIVSADQHQETITGSMGMKIDREFIVLTVQKP
jgi:SAM-dependent methyltransferase